MKQDKPDIYEELRSRLIAAEFAAGSKLKPSDFQADYGCSANTLRDVFFRLASEGLADFHDQRGFRVPQISRRKQHEITQMRIMLECEGACLSIRFGGVGWESRLTAVHHKLLHIERRIRTAEQAEKLLDFWMRAEDEFHLTLISACNSETLIRMHRMIYAQFRQQLLTADRTFEFITENIAQHQAIVDAAVDGDEPGVRKAIYAHLKRNLSPEPLPALQPELSASSM